eukprot:1461548-Lingulodinium_polyedra.AAC.1
MRTAPEPNAPTAWCPVAVAAGCACPPRRGRTGLRRPRCRATAARFARCPIARATAIAARP